jgi:hypothetical protein
VSVVNQSLKDLAAMHGGEARLERLAQLGRRALEILGERTAVAITFGLRGKDDRRVEGIWDEQAVRACRDIEEAAKALGLEVPK